MVCREKAYRLETLIIWMDDECMMLAHLRAANKVWWSDLKTALSPETTCSLNFQEPSQFEVWAKQIHRHLLVGKSSNQSSCVDQGMESAHGNAIQEPCDRPICVEDFEGNHRGIRQGMDDAAFAARLEITGTQLAGHQIRRRSTEADAFLEQQGTTQILASVFSVSGKYFQKKVYAFKPNKIME